MFAELVHSLDLALDMGSLVGPLIPPDTLFVLYFVFPDHLPVVSNAVYMFPIVLVGILVVLFDGMVESEDVVSVIQMSYSVASQHVHSHR